MTKKLGGSLDERVRIPAGDVELSGILTYPEERPPQEGVLLLSPHPHFAGHMDNNVLRRVAAKLGKRHAVLRFNYRGVEDSPIHLPEGLSVYDYWQRVEEEHAYEPVLEDARSAATYLIQSLGFERGQRLHLVGYSFGAILAGQLADRDREAASVVAIAPPLSRFDFSFLAQSPWPRAFLLGAEDFLYGEEEIQALCACLERPWRMEILSGADHFFRGQEAEVARMVAGFLTWSRRIQRAARARAEKEDRR